MKLICRELSSQEDRLRQEAAQHAAEAAASEAAASTKCSELQGALAAAKEAASIECSELQGELLKEQQAVAVLTQDLQAAKAQRDQVVVQLKELQATVASQAQSLPTTESAVGVAISSSSVAADRSSTADTISQETGSGIACMIELQAEVAPVVDAGSQNRDDVETGFIEALTQVTIEQLVFRLGRQQRHDLHTEHSNDLQEQQSSSISKKVNDQADALQVWLEHCHMQSYYDRLVAKVRSTLIKPSSLSRGNCCCFSSETFYGFSGA